MIAWPWRAKCQWYRMAVISAAFDLLSHRCVGRGVAWHRGMARQGRGPGGARMLRCGGREGGGTSQSVKSWGVPPIKGAENAPTPSSFFFLVTHSVLHT